MNTGHIPSWKSLPFKYQKLVIDERERLGIKNKGKSGERSGEGGNSNHAAADYNRFKPFKEQNQKYKRKIKALKTSKSIGDDTDKEELDAGDQLWGKAPKKKTWFSTPTWLSGHYGILLWRLIKTLIVSVLFCSRHRLCSQALYQRDIKQFRTTMRKVSGTRTNTKRKSNEQKFGRCELESHANNIVDGSNCVILQYTGKECNIKPFRDDYK